MKWISCDNIKSEKKKKYFSYCLWLDHEPITWSKFEFTTELMNEFLTIDIQLAVIESVQSWHKSSNAFKTMVSNEAVLRYMLTEHGINHVMISPKEWQKATGIQAKGWTGWSKKLSMWKAQTITGKQIDDPDIADSINIGYYYLTFIV